MSDTAKAAWQGALFVAVPFLFGAGLVIGAFDLVQPDIDKTRALCDQQVEALLHSKDLVEVTRAGILVNQLNCGIRRRL